MLKVHILSHKDGDRLAVVKAPWWSGIYDWLMNRICPCCGVTGWISAKLDGKFERAFDVYHSIWSGLLDFAYTKNQTLFEAAIEASCLASRSIFDANRTCSRDDCEYCWSDREDAFHSSSKSR